MERRTIDADPVWATMPRISIARKRRCGRTSRPKIGAFLNAAGHHAGPRALFTASERRHDLVVADLWKVAIELADGVEGAGLVQSDDFVRIRLHLRQRILRCHRQEQTSHLGCRAHRRVQGGDHCRSGRDTVVHDDHNPCREVARRPCRCTSRGGDAWSRVRLQFRARCNRVALQPCLLSIVSISTSCDASSRPLLRARES